jgi:enediyne biosynthesis protein E4
MTFIHRVKKLTLLLLIGLSLRCQTGGSDTLFTLLSESKTGVGFANNLEENDRFNIIKYLYYYNGGGVAAGDVNNDGLPDIFFTANQLSNKLYLNKSSKGASNFEFEDVTEKAGLNDLANRKDGPGKWTTGVTMADVNGDGWLDIYVCEVGFYKSVNGHNKLYINNQDGTFSEQAEAYGLDFKGFSQQASFFDYDLDGDLDMFLATHSVHSAESYDKAEKRSRRDPMAKDLLFRNDGGRFTDVSEEAGIYGGPMGYGLGLVTSDLNNDGLPDVYVTNDFHENDYLYLNSGKPATGSPQPGGFQEKVNSAMSHTSTFSMGVDVADVNNDGLLDVMTLDMKPEDEFLLKTGAGADHYNLYQMKLSYGYHYQFPRNSLQLAVQQPGGPAEADSFSISKIQNFRYSDVAELAGVAATDWSWSTLLADLDNDGWKDIFITNGIWHRPNDYDYLRFASNEEVQKASPDLELASKMPKGLVPNYAFRNSPTKEGRGVPVFENVSKKWGLDLSGSSNGAAYADFDGDGDLDLVVNNLNAPASIYRNNSEVFSKNNYLKIKLDGEGGNRFGVGARVSVTAGGTTQVQELSPTRGWLSSSDFTLNFGLGKNEMAEEVTVAWPGGKVQNLTQVKGNQTLTLRQSEASQSTDSPVTNENLRFHQLAISPISHRENRFTDFNIEPLMPHMLSTQGPKIAVADVNGDGLDDFYLCGAKAQPGQLVMGSQQALFGKTASQQPAFEQDFLCEDADARFFDADGDGDADLFVVSGGGEYREGAEQLRDRLYLNDGKGNFTKKTGEWPAANGACAVPADFNGDGATDLFLGSRSVPGSFGLKPKSFIYLNDGKGNFRDATPEICPEIQTVGMVTSAVWLPRERLLVIAGEWMPVTTVDFSQPKPAVRQLPHSQGLWNTLAAADFDGDGDDDLLAGNLGLNSVFTASPEEPLELFVKDFDHNGATDPVLTYYRQGKRYPFVSKDELVSQLPDLKKMFVKYVDYANRTFEQIFSEKTLEGAVRNRAETLQSMYFENLGGGNFKATPLPLAAQVAPIYAFLPGDFDGDGILDALAVGNFYENQPSIGRHDASFGWFLKGSGEGNFTSPGPSKSGFFVPGEGRDLKLAKGKDGRQWILVGRNNDAMLFFEIGKLRN